MTRSSSCFVLLLGSLLALPAGALAAPPSLVAIDVSEASAGSRIRLTGSDLGDPATSRVDIGGVPAPTATWTATAITAYVPTGVPAGAATVRVTTPEGHAERAITLVPRAPITDRIAWRFVGDGTVPGLHPPGLLSDGTIVVSDSAGFVYAIHPDGAVRWILDLARVLGVPVVQANRGPIAVGDDDVAYVGATSGTREHLVALDSDGALVWEQTFLEGYLSAGPSIGPDGDVYVLNAADWIVSTDPAGPSAGMLRLRAADGTRVWATRGDPPIVQIPTFGAPIAFGAASPGGPIDRAFIFADQQPLSSSPGDPQLNAVRAFALDDGRETFVAVMAPPHGSASAIRVWPAVRDDGVVLASSFVPSGVGNRVRFLDPASGAFVGMTSARYASGLGSPLAGRGDRSFVVRDASRVDAYAADGSLIWERFVNGVTSPNAIGLDADRTTIWLALGGRAIAIAAEDGALVHDVVVPGSGAALPSGRAVEVDDERARAYYLGTYSEASWELSAISTATSAPAPADAGVPLDDAGAASDGGVMSEADAGRTDAGVSTASPGGGCAVGSGRASAAWILATVLALVARRRRALAGRG